MNTKKISAKNVRKYLAIVVVYPSLPLFILGTNPERLPLPLLLVPFILFYSGLFYAIYSIGSHTRLLKGMEKRSQYVVAGLLSAIPLLLLVFQSLHQLTARDVVIALGLVLVTSFYISKADFLR